MWNYVLVLLNDSSRPFNDLCHLALIESNYVFCERNCILGDGVQTGSTRHVCHLLAYCTCPGWLWGWRTWWNEWQGKPKYSEKTYPGATLSTTNPTWPDPGLNPGRRGGKPATNRFSYGAASVNVNKNSYNSYSRGSQSAGPATLGALVIFRGRGPHVVCTKNYFERNMEKYF
jgi:hypothetical protein